jgi:hypothetical protein
MREFSANSDTKVVDHINCTIWHILGETNREFDLRASEWRWKMHYTEFTESVPIFNRGRATEYTVTCPRCHAAVQLRVLSAATALTRSYISIAFLILPFTIAAIALALLNIPSYEHWGVGRIILILAYPLIGTIALHLLFILFGLSPLEAIQGRLISTKGRTHIVRTYSRSDGRYPYDALSIENRRRTTLYAGLMGVLLAGVLGFAALANHRHSTRVQDQLRTAFESIHLPPATGCRNYSSFHSMSITCNYPSSVARSKLEESLTQAGWTSDEFFFRKDGNRVSLLCTSSCDFIIWSR